VSGPPRLAVILCNVLELEIEAQAEGMAHIVHIEKLEQGLHNDPPKLRQGLQGAIDRAEAGTDAEAIALGYGLCSRGVEGIVARRCLLVLPRAHDCITLLLGCRERYAAYVARHPGTYWYSPGWNRRHVPPGPERYRLLREGYAAQFGEENADYLMEQEQAWFEHYDRAAYVDQGVGPIEPDLEFTRECAAWLGWSFDHQKGDPGLIRTLLAGEWDEERFLVLSPGQTPRMTADGRVVEAANA
jgi:hypothetical protein